MPGFPVILVPGLGLGVEAWQQVAHGLAQSDPPPHRVTVALLPGYGRVANRDTDLGPQGLARRLLSEWLPGEGAGVVLVGHSASCQIVAHAAALAPERVRAVVLSGPTTDPRAVSWWALVVRWLATARHEPPWQVPSLVRQYRRTGVANMLRAMNVVRRDDVVQVLRTVTCPVLIVRGPDDRIAPQDWVDHLVANGSARTEPQRPVSAVTLPCGAHMLPLTEPARFTSAVVRFLASLRQEGVDPAVTTWGRS